jgi:uncharacterized protein YecE (DUF72 family)
MTELRIGTSGWSYSSWRGPFFPHDVKVKDHLGYYATRFDAAELNAPFYRTPTLEAVSGWVEQTPDDFRFAWKASKFITHWKRLTAKCENSLELMETRLKVLGEKTGPILFQLPPQFRADRERLASFIKMLNKRRAYAFEFRHESWYASEILDLLRDNDIALCISDHEDAPAPWEATARLVYVRGHGPTGRYHGRYPEAMLRKWADHIRRWRKGRHDVWCFFDNDQKSAAPLDAERLVSLLSPQRNTTRRRAERHPLQAQA